MMATNTGTKGTKNSSSGAGGGLLVQLGRIAGIGGMSLGVLFLLFSGVIQQNLSGLGAGNAARLLQYLLLFTFAVAVIGLLIWGSQVKMAWPVLVALLAFATLIPVVGYFMARPSLEQTYQVRVTVLSPQRTPVEDAKVWSSIGGEALRVAGGWKFDVPTDRKPLDGRMTIFAEQPAAFTKGETSVQLGEHPIVSSEILLARVTGARVRGLVVDKRGRAVSGARIFVVGYGPEVVVTGADGSFDLSAHAAEGQSVQVHAEKINQQAVTQLHPAGSAPLTIVLP